MFESFIIEEAEGLDANGMPSVLKFSSFKEEDFVEPKAYLKKLIKEHLEKRGTKKEMKN